MVKINNFCIDADDNCFIVKEVSTIQDKGSKNYGQEVYNVYGYYSTLEQAVRGIEKVLQRRAVKGADMGIRELAKVIREIHEDIFNNLKEE